MAWEHKILSLKKSQLCSLQGPFLLHAVGVGTYYVALSLL
jgi:hypothetical protein